jgi:Uncharacterised nucleotidyltransferase
MNNTSLSTPSLSLALSLVLPTPEQTLLLRTCLWSRDLARQAWEEWRIRYDGAETGFAGNNPSIRKLRPLLFNAFQQHDLQADSKTGTYLRSAYLKEELRNKIFRRICRAVLQLLQREDFAAIVLKGTALAETVYGNPVLRHCHDIDILLPDDELSRAANLLSSLGFQRANSNIPERNSYVRMQHESELPVELHSGLFDVPYYNVISSEIQARSQSRRIADVPVRILTPSDSLLHVCGHASHSASRQSLRWVTDAWFICNRHPDLDWDLLLECARRSRLALPLSVMLRYLAEDLNAPIARTFLNRLSAAASKSDAIERQLALRGTRAAGQGSLRELFRRTTNWRERVFLIQWLFFPSPRYLSWVDEIRDSWLLPFHYVYRPIRHFGWYVWSKFRVFIRHARSVLEAVFPRGHVRRVS